MDIIEAIKKRRAYRSLAPAHITDELIDDLTHCAQLFCSCFNNQPWRYVFVDDSEVLLKLHAAFSQGNEWAQAASMVIAVLSKPALDCVIKKRQYYLFDTGMATAAIILRATELSLVAHPIAGYNQKKTKEILNIPDEMEVIALVIVGKHADTINPALSGKQIDAEKSRPERFPFDKFAYRNAYVP